MVLKTKVRLSQSKKAWTQYVTIPSAVVQDSQYPFKDDDVDVYLEVEPATGLIIISKEDKSLKVTSEGDLIITSSKISKAELIVKQQIKNLEMETSKKVH